MGKRKAEGHINVNQELCDMLYDLADYEKNITRNIYKYNAYRQAAQILASQPVKITSGKEAKQFRGIGKKIADKIDEFLANGKLPKLIKIKEDQKFAAIQLLTKVSGIGPKKARELVDKGVNSIEELEKFKEDLNHHQQIGLKYFYDFQMKIPRNEVSKIEEIIKEHVAGIDEDFLVTICGSYRRGRPTCGDVDCLITHPEYTSNKPDSEQLRHESLLNEIIEKLKDSGLVIDTMALGSTKFMGVCRLMGAKPARRLDIRLTYMDQYYCSVLYFTGSDLFNKKMRAYALERGFTLNEYSLRPIGITGVLGKPLPVKSERDIFEYIDYPYKQPEERDL